ncbi:MAG: hypothetical protein MJK08_14605 [Campylobacterales bacterium]|nr:hypothetical protein [Campylobacterales bacterium]
MAKPDEDYKNEYETPEESYEEEDIVEEYETHSNNAESILDKPTIDNFFNTEQLLQEIEKTMKGFQKVDNKWRYKTMPKARDEFINSMINRLRSVINQQNMVSYITDDESKYLLLEKNYDFIFSVYEEPSIDDEDVESIINIYDHALQLFMGHTVEGFTSRTLRQIAAAVSYEVEKKPEEDGLLNIGYGKNNIIKLGGKK